MALIDVVIPNYQYGRYLRQCVESVVAQGIDDIRILIIDNASTDNSVEIARELAGRDRRIEVLARKKNLGPQASFNEGIDWASADYFTIVFADDLLLSGWLGSATAILSQRQNLALALGKEITFYDDKPLPEKEHLPSVWRMLDVAELVKLLCRELVCGPYVVRTPVQKASGYFDPTLLFTDDVEMVLRLASHGDVAVTSVIHALRRLHASNMAKVCKIDRATELFELRAVFDGFFFRQGKVSTNVSILQSSVNQMLAERAYWWGVQDLYRLNVKAAARLFQFAHGTHPRSIVLPPMRYLFRAHGPISRRIAAIARALDG